MSDLTEEERKELRRLSYLVNSRCGARGDRLLATKAQEDRYWELRSKQCGIKTAFEGGLPMGQAVVYANNGYVPINLAT